MKRLTYRLEDQCGNPTDSIILESDLIPLKSSEKLKIVLSRLAAIEDILGDEYELDRLRELVEADRLRAENEQLRERVRQLETRARTERCDAADYDCRELGALRREVSALRERLAADEWIDPAVELPPDDDMVLAIVSGKPADNIILEDAYELASYGSEGWIVEPFELWETPVVSWWRPLPDPPEKKKEDLTCRRS